MCHFDRHHRKPRSIGGKNDARNISYIPRTHHDAWHLLFQNWPAQKIAERINHWFLDPDYEIVVRRKEDVCQPLHAHAVISLRPNGGEIASTALSCAQPTVLKTPRLPSTPSQEEVINL